MEKPISNFLHEYKHNIFKAYVCFCHNQVWAYYHIWISTENTYVKTSYNIRLNNYCISWIEHDVISTYFHYFDILLEVLMEILFIVVIFGKTSHICQQQM